MEWDDLKHFLAVARSGSLRDASRALKTSAATVGRHVEALETRLGARLFEHRSTGYVLTDVGRSVMVRAEEAETAVLAVERQVLGTDTRAAGKVRVATTEDISSMVILPAVPAFRAKHPGIAIEIIARIDLSNLTRRDADVALRTVRPEKGDLLMRRVGRVDLAVYCSRAYAEVRGLGAGFSDFSKVEIITWVEEMATLRGGSWLAERAHNSDVSIRVNSTRMLFDACRAGLGVAVLPCFGADREPDLVCLLPPEDVLSVDAFVVMHRDLAQTARVRVVADFLASLGPLLGRQGRMPERTSAEDDWH
ncbi:MAG TPA: LysR family transcriptional regulator [Devosia sp.]|nr:LysR family transcriptional regulator [Devosia sp.]